MSKRKRLKVSIRKMKADEADFAILFEMLLELHKIGGYAPLDVEKAAGNAFDLLENGVALVAYVDGKPAGAIAGVETDFWYSQQKHLQSIPLYVREAYRNRNVGKVLLKAFAQEAESRGIPAFVTIDNPDRRPKATKMSIESQIAGYVPLGYTLKIR